MRNTSRNIEVANTCQKLMETCGHLIHPLELIPIVSWVVLAKVCCLQAPFKRYVLVEAGFALLGTTGAV